MDKEEENGETKKAGNISKQKREYGKKACERKKGGMEKNEKEKREWEKEITEKHCIRWVSEAGFSSFEYFHRWTSEHKLWVNWLCVLKLIRERQQTKNEGGDESESCLPVQFLVLVDEDHPRHWR